MKWVKGPILRGMMPVAGVDFPLPKNPDETKIIQNILMKIPKAPPEDTGEMIVHKINSLALSEDKKIDARHIKGWALIQGDKRRGIIGGTGTIPRGGMEAWRPENLSSQVNGSRTTFTTTQNFVRVAALWSSQYPGVLIENIHFTTTPPTTITMSSAVDVFQEGQGLLAMLQIL